MHFTFATGTITKFSMNRKFRMFEMQKKTYKYFLSHPESNGLKTIATLTYEFPPYIPNKRYQPSVSC